ncbi:hypothetical protein BJ508DRAFT_357377 [Ascobolus immersus RN42]|uniref:Uncharacterized protein n=1 Tax=Ascobolus immersus RN42 TaxID=1160509 RepID=A0A3N4J1K0_ASCIM|nr:hypothetical protein BJ508DRAFT_357377 [Ascobolus immersus RN42]
MSAYCGPKNTLCPLLLMSIGIAALLLPFLAVTFSINHPTHGQSLFPRDHKDDIDPQYIPVFTAPKEGNLLRIGTKFNISWTYPEPLASDVDLRVRLPLIDGVTGKPKEAVILDGGANAGPQVIWVEWNLADQILASVGTGDGYFLRVYTKLKDGSNAESVVESENFRIENAQLDASTSSQSSKSTSSSSSNTASSTSSTSSTSSSTTSTPLPTTTPPTTPSKPSITIHIHSTPPAPTSTPLAEPATKRSGINKIRTKWLLITVAVAVPVSVMMLIGWFILKPWLQTLHDERMFRKMHPGVPLMHPSFFDRAVRVRRDRVVGWWRKVFNCKPKYTSPD